MTSSNKLNNEQVLDRSQTITVISTNYVVTMEENNLKELRDKLAYYKNKVAYLEEIIQKSTRQKIKMAEIISKLLSRSN